MFAVVSLSILFNIPRYLDDHVVRKPDGTLVDEPTYLGKDDTFKLVYAGLFYYIIIYALPVVILAAMTYRLIKALRQFYKRREVVTKKAQAENDMTKTLVVVVLMFMIYQLVKFKTVQDTGGRRADVHDLSAGEVQDSSRHCWSSY